MGYKVRFDAANPTLRQSRFRSVTQPLQRPATMATAMSYSETFQNHRGNAADKWEGYLLTYDIELEPLRDRVRKMLEIGVQNGGSLEVFANYFQQAEYLVGLDICEDCRNLSFNDPRIHVEIGDATSATARQKLARTYGSFDLILDDGSHQSTDITQSFFAMLELLAPGGTYIAEDLCCVYWKEFGGGLKSPQSPMQLFKHLADVINHEHWRSGVSIADHLREMGYVDISPSTLERIGSIRSISFHNSICIIRTNTFSFQNKIGKRFCRGDIYALGFRSNNGEDISSVGQTQTDNPYNLPAAPPAAGR